MTRLRVKFPDKYAGYVIAELLEVKQPDDSVEIVSSSSRVVSSDGLVSMPLDPTKENQAYKIYLTPAQPNVLPQYVRVPLAAYINIEDCISVNPSTLSPFGSSSEPVEDPTWDEVKEKPESFPPVDHTHGIPEVEGLTEALGNKQDKGTYVTQADMAAIESLIEGLESRVVALEGL